MPLRSSVVALVFATAVVFGPSSLAVATQGVEPARIPDVIYLPTPPDVVARMLSLARVGPGDIVFDLGSGDGRIVIAAVRDFGASLGFGVELAVRSGTPGHDVVADRSGHALPRQRSCH